MNVTLIVTKLNFLIRIDQHKNNILPINDAIMLNGIKFIVVRIALTTMNAVADHSKIDSILFIDFFNNLRHFFCKFIIPERW